MNLNQNPSVKDLKKIFASADDNAGHHMMWVDISGDVHLSMIPDGVSAVEFQGNLKSLGMKCCFSVFSATTGDVGVEASESDQHMGRMFKALVKAWSQNPKLGSFFDLSELL